MHDHTCICVHTVLSLRPTYTQGKFCHATKLRSKCCSVCVIVKNRVVVNCVQLIALYRTISNFIRLALYVGFNHTKIKLVLVNMLLQLLVLVNMLLQALLIRLSPALNILSIPNPLVKTGTQIMYF